jgi:hypothetical protein
MPKILARTLRERVHPGATPGVLPGEYVLFTGARVFPISEMVIDA